MPKTVEELSGYDKAAIIYDILGGSVAVTIFKDLPESELYELRKHANKIKRDVSNSVKKEVLDDYYVKMLSVGKYQQVSLNINMFDFLDNLNDEQVYYLINTESAKIIALALDQFSEDRKFKVLSRFSNQMKHNIIIEFAELSEIPLEGVVNIANELKHSKLLDESLSSLFQAIIKSLYAAG